MTPAQPARGDESGVTISRETATVALLTVMNLLETVYSHDLEMDLRRAAPDLVDGLLARRQEVGLACSELEHVLDKEPQP